MYLFCYYICLLVRLSRWFVFGHCYVCVGVQVIVLFLFVYGLQCCLCCLLYALASLLALGVIFENSFLAQFELCSCMCVVFPVRCYVMMCVCLCVSVRLCLSALCACVLGRVTLLCVIQICVRSSPCVRLLCAFTCVRYLGCCV